MSKGVRTEKKAKMLCENDGCENEAVACVGLPGPKPKWVCWPCFDVWYAAQTGKGLNAP